MKYLCIYRASTGKAPVAPRRNRRGMQAAETRTLQPNCQLCQCRCGGLPFRHGGGGRHLGCAERVAAAQAKFLDPVALYPSVYSTGGSVECIGAGAVSVDFGAGGFHCLCSPELYRRLYAGAQPFSGGACRSSIGSLQWGSAGRYSGHCALCSKAGAGDLGAGPGNSSHRL